MTPLARIHPKDKSAETEAAWQVKRALLLHELLEPACKGNPFYQEAVQQAHAGYAMLVERDAR